MAVPQNMKNVSGLLPYERWQNIDNRRTIVRLEKTLCSHTTLISDMLNDMTFWHGVRNYISLSRGRVGQQCTSSFAVFGVISQKAHNEKSLNTASISIRARRRCLSVWEKWRDSRMRGKTLSAFFLFPFSLKWGERACELSARPTAGRPPRNEC